MGLFITFEGIDGSGKSTVMKEVKKILENEYKILTFKEPCGIPQSEHLREKVFDTNLSAFDRFRHFLKSQDILTPVIQRHFIEGYIVMCDRFTDSSIAYFLAESESSSYIDGNLGYKPDITFYIDISLETRKKRIQCRASNNPIDEKDDVFFERVKGHYEEIIAKEPERFVRIDGEQSIYDVVSDVVKAIRKRLEYVQYLE